MGASGAIENKSSEASKKGPRTTAEKLKRASGCFVFFAGVVLVDLFVVLGCLVWLGTNLLWVQLAALQHFVTLALLSTVVILFPGVLLFGFALHRVPRLCKNLEDDLTKLGIGAEAWKEVETVIEAMTKKVKSASKDDPTITSEGVRRALTNPEAEPELSQKLERVSPEDTKKCKNKLKEAQFEVGKHITERYGAFEFLVPLTLLTLFLLASVLWAFWPQGIYRFGNSVASHGASLHTYFSSTVATMSPALVAVLVAYLFMAYGLVRRYHRSDITPGAFWEVFRRLFVVFLLGLVLSALFKANPNPGGSMAGLGTFGAILIGIFAGVFPIRTLQIMTRGGQVWLQRWLNDLVSRKDAQQDEDFAQSLRRRHDLTFLDDIDQWDVERIEEEGVIGMQGMATVDIANLVTWTPFPTYQIVDWVDQAILYLAAGAEPELGYVKTLRQLGFRGASDFVDATKDPEGKLRVVLAARTIRGMIVEDPIPLAQLAGLRAQLKVKEAHEKVAQVEGKNKDDDTADIASALDAVRVARWLVDDAHKQVKAGGDALKDALAAATELQSAFKAISSKSDEVETALKAVTDSKVSEQLQTALQSLGQKITADVDSQAQTLVDELDRIAHSLLETESKARELLEKAEAIDAEAERGAHTKVPTATFSAATPPLTTEILECILAGLEHNPNLRRIHRYLREATAEVPPATSYFANIEWLKLSGLSANRLIP